MKDIKKLMITLVALLTAVTGAWADQLASSYSSNATLNAVTVSASMEVTIATGVTVTINNGLNITSGTLTVKGPGTLVVNGKAGSNGSNGDTGGNGTPGSAAITGNIIVQGGATVKATGGNGGNGGMGNEDNGGHGANGAAAISGNVTVLGGATVKATGGNGGNGGYSDYETGGNGAQGGAAITGEVTIQDASTLEATGGNGGNGGNGEGAGGNGGNGANAIGGTLNYKGGTVTADGGNGGSGGDGGYENGSGGSAGKAFTTSVNFVSSDYILTDGTNAITATQVTSKKKVVIIPKVLVNSVTLSQTSASMTVGGDALTLTATVAPDDATDKTVTWTTSDANVATVTDGVVTAVAAGTATITVTATNGTADNSDDKTATCTVTVSPSGPTVAWDKTAKTGSFTMPGGNVTLEPEYYTQATVADGGVTAADADARATTDDPLVKVDATKLTGAKKLMYFVSNSGTTAPAYDAEGWTDQLPTAEGFTQQGIVYVWYYPVGTDEGVDGATATYSDGDICLQSITARIAAEPTYAVTFADGTAEPTLWTASPNAGVKKGQQVTVTYTGSKKVIGVKAEKKSAAGIVNPVVGQIIGSDGKNYAADATLPDGVTAVAMIAYVSGSNGLALALTDEGAYTWDNSAPLNKGKTAPEICSALNTSKAVTGGTWKLPSKDEWKQMFSANGGNEYSYTGLNTAIGNAGGTALIENDAYWSSSEVDDDAWLVDLADGAASWDTYGKHYNRFVRAVLAF